MSSSVAMFPVAPGAYGQPPRPPTEASKSATPSSSAVSTFASPVPRVLWKCRLSAVSGCLDRNSPTSSRTRAGVAIPVVSPNETESAPSATARLATPTTRCTGTSPSYGQPHAVETITWQVAPAWCAWSMRTAMSSSDSSVLRFTFLRLCVSEADTTASSSVNPASSARAAPREFGTRAEYLTPGVRVTCRQTSSASAICGMALGCTKDTASIRCTPVPDRVLISSTLAPVGTGSSFCRPSLGPTSRSDIRSGRSLTVILPLLLAGPAWLPLLIERRDALCSIRGEHGRPPRGILDVQSRREPGSAPLPDGLLRRPNGHRRIARDEAGQVERVLARQAGPRQAVGQADPVCLAGVDLAPGQDHVGGPSRTQPAQCELGAAAAGDQPDRGLRQAEDGGLVRHDQIAAERELAAAAEGVAVHRGHRRLGQAQ